MKKSFLLLIVSLFFTTVYAQWSTDPAVNNAVCSFAGEQTNVQLVTDGAGGSILTWLDYRATSYDIYAQRISATGALLWNIDGVAICTAISDQFEPRIISDGAGGAIIIWYDNRVENNRDIYAQRINADGLVQWTTDGVPICTAAGNQSMQQLTTDNHGGAIIVWSDSRNGGPNADIYAQSINSAGAVQWPADGVAICTALNSQSSPQLTSDEKGGAIITWSDFRGEWTDIYAQRISSTGDIRWSYNGVPVCMANYHQDQPRIVPDGISGAVICWQDNRNDYVSGLDTYVQKIDSTGVVQWAANGVAVCNAQYLQSFNQMVADGSGGAYITWEDRRSYSDIYAQKISTTGVPQWTLDGIPICTSDPVQKDPQLCLNSSGDLVVVWTDNYGDIYAQSVSPSGVLLWTIDGVPVCNDPATQSSPQIISGSAEGVIIAWRDTRNGSTDIYSQRINTGGTLTNLRLKSDNAKSFKLYPNPGKGIFTIQVDPDQIYESSISITNLIGEKIYSTEVQSETTPINLSDHPKGIYLISIQTHKGKSSQNLIIN